MITSIDVKYMRFAFDLAKLSYAKRAKVGAVLVTKQGVMLPGYNGTPSGWNNTCEDAQNNTKPEVIHAELNCIMKAAREGVSCVDATVYVTLAPCRACAAMLAQAGVNRVVYSVDYRDIEGVNFLMDNGVIVERIFHENLNIKE